MSDQAEDDPGAAEPEEPTPPTLTKADLILDAALKDKEGDKFGHTEIATIVGNLSAYVEMPVNIALFGPWGSGKSSLFSLIRGELLAQRKRDPDFPNVVAIQYDAWKFSGTPLKRTFITNAAEQLKLDKTEFRADLYENRSSLQLPLKEVRRQWKRLLNMVGITFVALVVGGLLMATLWALGSMLPKSEWNNSEFRHLWWEHLRDLGKYALIGFLPLIGGIGLLDFAKVTVTRSAPREDEEFQDAFDRLMENALNRKEEPDEAKQRKSEGQAEFKQWDRVLIFVDELDRCAPDDVLETLIGIKTFLEHPKCVFVVAADRDVLEEALNKGQGDRARQATPVRQYEPYYSTAGAFLDKMFQYQLELPTLRRHKLSVFAKEVVEAQPEGIWGEFTPTQLEDVIHALIPLHVRSPRRVKVLLNAFATTARIADARGVKWRDNPATLSKLTVLRTEFPRFANDLQLEPRLVKHLEDRDAPGEDATRRLRDLYGNYTLGTELALVEDEEEEEAEEEDPPPPPPSSGQPQAASPLISSAEHDEDAVLRAQITINEHLLDYLEKTKYARIPGPTRALLHLEAAGLNEGLANQELAAAIDEAPDRSPETTLEAFKDASPRDRAIAARILGAEVDQQVGPGKASVAETVCGLVEGLDRSEVARVAASIAPSVARVVGSPLGTSAMIPGMLALGSGQVEVNPILDRFRVLVHDPENKSDLRLTAVADVLPCLPKGSAKIAAGVIVDGLGRGKDDGVIRILETAPTDALQRYWSEHAATIVDFLQSRLASAASAGTPLDAETLYDSFFDPLLGRADVSWGIVIDLLHRMLKADDEHYAYVHGRVDADLPQPGHEKAQNDLALTGLAMAATEDWPFWLALLSNEPADPAPVRDALISLIGEVDPTSPTDLGLLKSAADQLAPMTGSPAEIGAEILASATTRLSGFTWDTTARAVHQAFDSMLAHFHPDIKDAHDDLEAGEVMRAIALGLTDDGLDGLIAYIEKDLSDEAARKVLDQLRATVPESTHNIGSFRALSAAQARCADIAPIGVAAFDRIRPADGTLDAAWLAFNPSVAEVVDQYTRGISLDENAVAQYAADLDVEPRTELWVALESQSRAQSLLRKVAAPGVTAASVAHIFDGAAHGSSDSIRRAEADRLALLPIGDDALIEKATDLMETLLLSGTKSNVPIAATVALHAGRAQTGRIVKIKNLFNSNSDELTYARLLSLWEIGLANKPKKTLGGFLFGKKSKK